jgi:hypothetical protein
MATANTSSRPRRSSSATTAARTPPWRLKGTTSGLLRRSGLLAANV